MTQYFPVVIEQEENGTYSAWVAGLPGVYAAADTASSAKRGIQRALVAHLDALRRLGRLVRPKAHLLVLRCEPGEKSYRVRPMGMGALMGRATSRAKSEAARRNGRKGGRPRATP